MIYSIFEFDGKICSLNTSNYRPIFELQANELENARYYSCDGVKSYQGNIYYGFDTLFYQINLIQGFLNHTFRFDLKTLSFKDGNGILCWDEECCLNIFWHSLFTFIKTDKENYGEYTGRKQKFILGLLDDPFKLEVTRNFVNKYACHKLMRNKLPELYAKLFPNEGVLSYIWRRYSTPDNPNTVPVADLADISDLDKKDDIPVAEEFPKRRFSRRRS